MTTRKALSDRWSTETGQALAEEVIARLIARRPLDGLELAEHEGRVDLRYLPAPAPKRLERFETQGWSVQRLGNLIELTGASLEGLDLSGAQLQSFRFFDTRINNCRFDGANCRDWRLWASEITDSSFTKANLAEAAVGTSRYQGRRNVWRRVDFSGSDFRIGVSDEAVYEDCDFSGAKLDKVNFGQCAFVRCRFAGKLNETVFDGRDLSDQPAPPQMDAVDFSDAFFSDVEFAGFDLEAVTLPNDPDIHLVRRARCVARHGIEMLGDDNSIEADILRSLFERTLKGPGTEQDAQIFNRRDYLASGGSPELLALAEDIYQRAEAACQ